MLLTINDLFKLLICIVVFKKRTYIASRYCSASYPLNDVKKAHAELMNIWWSRYWILKYFAIGKKLCIESWLFLQPQTVWYLSTNHNYRRFNISYLCFTHKTEVSSTINKKRTMLRTCALTLVVEQNICEQIYLLLYSVVLVLVAMDFAGCK